MSDESLQLTLMLETDATTDLMEERGLTVRLPDELLKSDNVVDAEFAGQFLAAPSGTKSPTQLINDPILLTLAVTAIPSTILLIQHWLLRQQNQTIKVKVRAWPEHYNGYRKQRIVMTLPKWLETDKPGGSTWYFP